MNEKEDNLGDESKKEHFIDSLKIELDSIDIIDLW